MARAARFVDQVLAGEVIACKWVKLACKRHRANLRASRRPNFRWHYDEARAERFIRFHEGLPHVKDDFRGRAAHHERFHLEDHQCFELCSIFGWVDKKEGFRRFNEVYVEKPRKNGKTPNAAAVGLFCLTADGEYGAEVFAGAASKDQASEVFDAARNMALASPQFRSAFGVWVNKGSLVVVDKNASFKRLKGQPADGPAPNCTLADEYHEYKNNRLIAWAQTGMMSRRQPLLFEITTAGNDTSSPCYEKHLEVQEVLEGRRRNERLFGIIYTIDKGVDWKSEKALRMANPNYGVSVNPETIRHEQQQARGSATREAAFKTKNLNVWVNAAQPWIPSEKWDDCCDQDLRLEDFEADPCVLSIDLASRKDTVSTASGFKRKLPGADGQEQEHYFFFTRHYLNRERVREDRNTHFADWCDRGFLIETEGSVTDYGRVAEDLAASAGQLLVRELVFDPYHALPFFQLGLEPREDWPASIEVAQLKQNEENLSAAMKELEAAILSRRLHHDGNPVLAWMIGNTRCRLSQKDNWYPVRENAERKIDGTIALILGVNRLMQLDVDADASSGRVIYA